MNYTRAIIWLSVLDSFLTLQIIHTGGVEINPAMDWLLDFGPVSFFVGKLAIVACGALFLGHYKDVVLFNVVRVERILAALNLIYVALVAYEINLLLWIA